MACVAAALGALAALRPTTGLFLVLLALVGIGIGAFLPPNNAAIVWSAPPDQAGVASGVVNMTRGMGTSLGLAITGLVFGHGGGDSAAPEAVGHAFAVTSVVLAGIALAAGIVAGVREGGPFSVSPEVMVE